MIDGSNRLPVLMNEIKNANVVFEAAKRTTADAIMVMGRSLVEAKQLCAHGEWVDFLRESGVSPRSAQRYMRVVEAGITSEYLSIVGLAGALEEIEDALAAMPARHEAMLATWEADDEPDVMIWWATGKYTAGFLQAYRDEERPDRARVLIVDSIPAIHAATLLEYFTCGLPGDEPRREISRRAISHQERDHKVAFARENAR